MAIEELEQVHRLSVDEYRRLVQAEVFDEVVAARDDRARPRTT